MRNFELTVTVGVLLVGCVGFGFANVSATKEKLDVDVKSTLLDTIQWGLNFEETNKPNKSSELFYYVGGKHSKTVSQETLKAAAHLADIIPNYPSLWIDSYESVTITIEDGHISKSVKNKGPELVLEQKRLISNLSINSEIVLDVKYWAMNGITKELELHEMNMQFVVVPKQKAEFKGGYEAMISYLKSKMGCGFSFDKKTSAEIHFVINTKGETESVSLVYVRGSEELGARFVEIIEGMPNWKSAHDVNGKKSTARVCFYCRE